MLTTEVENSHTTIIGFLKTSLKSRRLSLSDIERNTGLTYSTLNRTFNDKRDFTAIELVEVLNYLYTADEVTSIINQFYPNQSALFNLYSDIKNKNKLDIKHEKYFVEFNSFALANMINLGHFKNASEIKQAYGMVGINLLENMAKDKLVSIKPNGEITSNLDPFKPSFSTIRKQIAHATQYHKDENCGKLKNFIYFGAQLVSKEKRAYIYRITRLFRDMISSIIHDDKLDIQKYNEFDKLINNYSDSMNKEKTEPIFYSILFDDFRTTDKTERILQ